MICGELLSLGSDEDSNEGVKEGMEQANVRMRSSSAMSGVN